MALVEWSKNFVIGIPFVDSDHKVLVSLLNQVHDAAGQREEMSTLESVLGALVDYTAYHFSREERLMELSAYSGLKAHIGLHESLGKQVKGFRDRFVADPNRVEAEEVEKFLKEWLLEHILEQDFDYGKHCIGNEVAIQEVEAMQFLCGNENASAPDWESLSVLVVDDNLNFRRLLSTILKAVGVRNIRLSASAQDGIDQLLKHPADVVLCDWVMDEMNGAEFAHEARTMGLDTKIIMMTGFSMETVRQRTQAAEIDGYIGKPLSVRTLLTAISEAVAG
jgi:hemerythrin-like metal-binding protein